MADIETVGYVTAAQGQNRIIHIVTSKNSPNYEIELNESRVIKGGQEARTPERVERVDSYRETYPDGRARVSFQLSPSQ